MEVNSVTREEAARIERDTRALYVRLVAFSFEYLSLTLLSSQDEARLSLMDVKRAVWGLEEHTRLLQEDRARTIRIV